MTRVDEMDFVQSSSARIDLYWNLFHKCFKGYNKSMEYLSWLYSKNPRGEILGYDAFVEDQLVAHYVCIPIKLSNSNSLSLLSLNTATHPEFQGRGLFTRLASLTYEHALESGFHSVIGVANRNSISGFVKRLDFSHLGDLNLRFGPISRSSSRTREYSDSEIDWLRNQPNTRVHINLSTDGVYMHNVFFPKPVIKLTNFCFSEGDIVRFASKRLALTVDWNSNKLNSLYLPESLKPSPLSLIYKRLNANEDYSLDSWSYADFDMV